MTGNARWPRAVSLGLLTLLIASAGPAGAAGGGAARPPAAPATPRAAEPALTGALPES